MTDYKSKKINRLNRCRLALAVGLAGCMAAPAMAGTLLPGEVASVWRYEPAQDWFVFPGAQLTLETGASSHEIFAMGDSRVIIKSADVQSQSVRAALSLVNSSTVVTDSRIASDGLGLSVSSDWSHGDDKAFAILVNSTVQGGRAGMSVDSGDVIAVRSRFEGGAVGVEMADGRLTFSQGTRVSGDTGLEMKAAWFFADTMGNHLLLDSSHVEGRSGSAIVVKADNLGERTEAEITLRNGSTLTASNGVLVAVEAGADVGVSVSGSHLTGQLLNVNRLNLADNASWTMTRDATVGALTMDRGTVNLAGGDGDFRQLTLDRLEGNGQFNMGVDLAALQGDLLKVNGTASGDFKLKIANSGHEPAAGAGALTVVQTGGGDAHFDVLGGQVEAGAYAYELQREGDDWALVQKVDRQGRSALSASSQSVLGLYNAAPVVWSGELTGLRSRFDELRRTPAATGLWMRAQAAKYEVGHTDLRTYDMRQSGFTLGSDLALSQELTVGLLAGTSKADLDFSRGTRASIDSVFVGAYAGWTEANGLYVDTLVKANRFSNRADVLMSDGVKARGKYRDFGLGGSVELGKRITLGEGWYLKPYGQLTALSMQGQAYTLSNGLAADSNAARSLNGRLGSQFGRTLAMAGGGTLQPYVKVAASREFASGNQAQINGQTFDNSLKGNSIELGTGFTAQLSEAWQMNAEFDYATGHRVDQPYGLSAGLRYAF